MMTLIRTIMRQPKSKKAKATSLLKGTQKKFN